MVPLTSPVQLTNLNDIHAVDLHVRYCELVKAYEQLVCTLPHKGPPGRPWTTTQRPRRSRRARCVSCCARAGALTPLPSPCAGAGPKRGQEGL